MEKIKRGGTTFYKVGLEDGLKTERDLQGFIEAAIEYGDPGLLQAALGEAARIRGMHETAQLAGLNEKSLYRALSKNGNPRLSTLQKVLDVFGLELTVRPKHHPREA